MHARQTSRDLFENNDAKQIHKIKTILNVTLMIDVDRIITIRLIIEDTKSVARLGYTIMHRLTRIVFDSIRFDSIRFRENGRPYFALGI